MTDSPTDSRSTVARAGQSSWQIVGIVAVAYVALHIVGLLRLVVVPVFVAILISTLLVPLARAVERRGVPRLLAAWVAFLTLIAALVAVVYLVAPSVSSELGNLTTTLGNSGDEIKNWLTTGPLKLSKSSIDDFSASLSSQTSDAQSRLLHGAISRAPVVVEDIAAVLLTFVLTFFFVKDGDRIVDRLAGMTDQRHRGGIDRFLDRAWHILGGYFRGSAVNGLVNAAVLSIALWIIGVPLIVPIAVLTFFGSFLPVVGAIASGGVAAAVALVEVGPTAALVVIGVTILIHHLESYIVGPLVMRRAVHLHPVAVILSIAAGSLAFGILGAFVAVPTVAVVTAAIDARARGDDAEQADDDAATPKDATP